MEDISLHIMDIIENSISGGATEILVKLDSTSAETLICTISDNGCGMSEREVEMAVDPFYTTKVGKRWGLGLALFKQSAEETEGFFDIVSDRRKGTTVQAFFHTNHPDMRPLGDIEGTVSLLKHFHPKIKFRYEGGEE